MNFLQATNAGFKNFFNVRDRAARAEYWWFILFCYVLAMAAAALDAMLLPSHAIITAGETAIGPLYLAVALVVTIPSFTVAVRRLHDIDRRGWWMLVNIVPLIGALLFLYWCCKRGTDGPNRFGEDPLSFYVPGRRAL